MDDMVGECMEALFLEEYPIQGGIALLIVLPPEDFLQTFARISTFAEHPVFQGDEFSLRELQEYWMENQGRPYEEDIFGCNFSARDLVRFVQSNGSDLSSEEGWLIGLLGQRKDIYVAALNQNPPLRLQPAEHGLHYATILKHEMSHALYWMDPAYRSLINDCWNSVGSQRREEIYQLYAYYYASHRIVDEWSAHIVSSYELQQVLDISDEHYLGLKRYFWERIHRPRFESMLQKMARSMQI
ncbi:MAG: hypothetical protein KDK23_13075 [Leptospiraceae bacterium]|nr:hypothetical protein [Leptospiraceae bacterium]